MKYANANTNTNKSAPKTNRHTGREIGLELRKTHFVLGIDGILKIKKIHIVKIVIRISIIFLI